MFADVARSWGEGHWPLLSPYSWACGNLAGEYQYGTFSVFINAVVAATWKFPLTFAQQAAALSVSHLAVLAAGGYVLARERRLRRPTGNAGVGIIAALNGWEDGLGGDGLVRRAGGERLAAVVLVGVRGGVERSRTAEGRRQKSAGRRKLGQAWRGKFRFLLPAPFVYLLVAAGFPYTDVMLGLVTAWLALRSNGVEKGMAVADPARAGDGLDPGSDALRAGVAVAAGGGARLGQITGRRRARGTSRGPCRGGRCPA